MCWFCFEENFVHDQGVFLGGLSPPTSLPFVWYQITLLWRGHNGVNNLPRLTMQPQCDWNLNLWHLHCKSDTQPVRLTCNHGCPHEMSHSYWKKLEKILPRIQTLNTNSWHLSNMTEMNIFIKLNGSKSVFATHCKVDIFTSWYFSGYVQ